MAEKQPKQSSDPLGIDSTWYTAAGLIAVVIGVVVYLAMRDWHLRVDHRNAAAGLQIERYPLLATQPVVTAAIVFLVLIGIERVYLFMLRMEAK